MNLEKIQQQDLEHADIKKNPKSILRKWCELHVLDHHKFVLLDKENHCYYIYEKKFTDFKPHHFNGDDFFNFNKFIQNNENDTVFQNKDFKIILVGENLKKKQRDTISKNVFTSLKKKKATYICF